MQKKIRWRGLRTKIIAWSFVPTVIILAAVALVNFYAYQQVTEDLVIERNRELARLSADQLAATLTEYTNFLTVLASTGDIRQGDPAAQRDTLENASNRLTVFDGGVLILDAFGKVTAVHPERPEVLGQNWSGRTFYLQILRYQIFRSPGPAFSRLIEEGLDSAQVIVVAVPITGEYGEFVGTVAGMFRVGRTAASSFSDSILQLATEERGNAYLVDDNGRVIYHSDPGRIGQDFSGQAAVQRVLSGEVDAIRTRDFENRDIVSSFAPVPGTSWGLVTEESWAALINASQSYRQFLVSLLVLGLVVPALVVAVGVRRVTQPIMELIGAAQEVARGNFGQKISARTGDELEELAEQFNFMSIQLQELYAYLEQKVADRTRELATLNAIAAVVSRSLDLEEVLSDALDETLALLKVEAGVILLLEPDGETMNLWVHRGCSEVLVEALRRIRLGEGITGQAAARGEPMVLDVSDYARAEYTERLAPLTLGEGFQTLVGIPLVSKGQVMGGLSLATKRPRAFPPEKVELLMAIGQQIGVAVENARLYTSVQQELSERVQAEEKLREAKEAAEEARMAADSARIAAEEARRVAEAARQTAERANQAKSVFLANMSHELRTPLNAILGFTQLMARDPNLTPGQQGNLETIGRSGEHLLALINDVLELSKIEAGRVELQEESFDLHRLLAGLEEMFWLRTEAKGLDLIFDQAPDVPQYVRADEGKLRQVLINLLGNAVKFTEEGGITLRVGSKEYEVRSKEYEVRSKGEETPLLPTPYSVQPLVALHFEVEDTGPGIAPEELDAIFDAFVQTTSGRQSQQGTGLGLAISHEFVRMMGGELVVSSPSPSPPVPVGGGQGSLFRFDIRVELASQSEILNLRSEISPRRVVGLEPGQPVYRLLIVEDVEANRRLLVELLSPLDFELREAVNGQEAIAVWEEWRPHLIWMDMRMPVMDGREATRRIRAKVEAKVEAEGEAADASSVVGRFVRIIALTASVFEEERAEILADGCDDFVRKPFREAEIFEVLSKHLGVRFVYEAVGIEEEARRQGDKEGKELTTEALTLAEMPAEWVAELRQATLEGDLEWMAALIEQIEGSNPVLAERLTELTYKFEHDEILWLIERSDDG